MIARPSRPGFTLLEILLVMAILVILLSVAYPSLDALYGDTRVRGAADDVRGAWAEARVRSIDNGVPYRFAVQSGKGTFCIAPDSSDYWDGTKAIGSEDMDDGKVLVGSLPNTIVFNLTQDIPEDAGGWRSIVTFLPDGTCKEDASVRIREGSGDSGSNGGSYITVSVRGLTGIVTVKTKKQEEGR